jgi:hypothetical protein
MKWFEYLKRFQDVMATVILGTAIIGMLIWCFNYLNQPEISTQKIVIEYNLVTDSAETAYILDSHQFDSLMDSITNLSNNVVSHQIDLQEQVGQDRLFDKVLTALAAIVLAIAGFFGFKSINDIKLASIEEATSVSSKIANSQFSNLFDQNYRTSVFKEAVDASMKITSDLESRISELEMQVVQYEDLESRIRDLELINQQHGGADVNIEEDNDDDENDDETVEDPTPPDSQKPFEGA